MSIPRCYGFKDGCIFVSKFQTTSLLDICNLVMQMDKTNVEPIAMYFTIEMLNILEKLHKSQIIHANAYHMRVIIENLETAKKRIEPIYGNVVGYKKLIEEN